LLDRDYAILAEVTVTDAVEYLADADDVPHAIVVDGELTQKLLDVAAQRGVEQVVARELAQFTKRPTSVRIRTADQLAAS